MGVLLQICCTFSEQFFLHVWTAAYVPQQYSQLLSLVFIIHSSIFFIGLNFIIEFQENTCGGVSFLNKVVGWRPTTLLKRYFGTKYFLENFSNFSRAPLLQNTLKRLLLYWDFLGHLVLYQYTTRLLIKHLSRHLIFEGLIILIFCREVSPLQFCFSELVISWLSTFWR